MWEQRPHNIDVRMGSSRVVSILYIGLPASGKVDEPGVQLETSELLISLGSAQPIAYSNRKIPTNENGAAMEIEMGELSMNTMPVPKAMQVQATNTIFEMPRPLPIWPDMPMG